MQFDTEATICAIATGHENGYRGAVRMAGWSALEILENVQAMPESLRTTRYPMRVSVAWDLKSRLGSLPVDIWWWPTHRSYTGTPSIEIHTLGNQLLLKRIVEQLCDAGARIAMPGEFTLRAFLAGRIDLTQCEAVLGVIEAKSQATLDVALRQLAGGLSKPLANLRKSLIDLLADLEAGLDFVDEDISFIGPEQVIERLAIASEEVESLSGQLDQRQNNRHLPKVVFLGLPNAGKSSLVNALAQENAAIVSDLAGTTRDFVRVRCPLQHGEIELVDTAGIESRSEVQGLLSEIEQLAQHRAMEQGSEADLILYCIDSQLNDTTKREQLTHAHSLLESNVWVLWTKADLHHPKYADEWMTGRFHRNPTFVTSSFNRACLTPLLDELDDWFIQRNEEASAVAPMTAVRCKESLRGALESLRAAHEAAEQIAGDEIVASEIRMALEQLGQVAGEVYTDDVLDALFSRFCIGK